MSSVSRNRSGRRRLLFGQEARELRRELFRLFGQDPEYCDVITGFLRGYWRDVVLPADYPDRYNFRALREQARQETTDPEFATYVDAVERFVSHELHLNADGSPAEWAGNYVHSHVVPPENMVKYIHMTFPREDWDAKLDEMVFALGGDRWDNYTWPDDVALDSTTITIAVSPAGALVQVEGSEPITLNCHPGEWMSFDRLDDFETTARAVVDNELQRLRATFQERYGRPNRNRSALDRDVQGLLPQLSVLQNRGGVA
jgi:hypothetical protein